MRTSRRRPRSRGQIVIIFALAIIAFVGLCAVVIDVSWFWSNSLRIQRAADAAALAGVVNLPGNPGQALIDAQAEAKKNGYDVATPGVFVDAVVDVPNLRRLKVTITAPVGTFFARVLGISSIQEKRDSKAEYTLPVPMGSPENYYGVFGLTRGLTSSQTVSTPVDTPSNVTVSTQTAVTPNTATGGASPANSWTANTGTTIPANLAANESDTTAAARYVSSTTNNSTLDLGNFGLTTGLAANQSVTAITGLQVLLDDAYLSAACGATTNRFLVQVSYDGGTHWSTSTTTTRTANLGINTATVDTTIGVTTDMTAWTFAGPAHGWDPDDFDQANFKVRLTASKACGTSGTQLRLDQLRVTARYAINTRTFNTSVQLTNLTDQVLQGPKTPCPGGVANCFLADDGTSLNARGFWATMNTQGAANGNGDAYQPFYDSVGGAAAPPCATAAAGLACYDPTNYYNYAVEMPLGATGGKVYVYDPVFCATNNAKGTGDRWFTSNKAVTSVFELYDTKDTLYDQSDDGTALATSGGLFRQVRASDSSMGGPATTTGTPAECRSFSDATYGDGRDYHNDWYLLYSGMTGGINGPKIYRLHTTSTDPANVTDQKTTDGENSFALYASASGGTPRLYGIGAMQAFTPLKAGTGVVGGSPTTVTSTFYLAEIERAHAGKTVEITLWDPGDTDPLTASLEILMPTGPGSWTPASVTYSATLGTTNSGRADGTNDTNGFTKPNCPLLKRTTASTAAINTYDTAASSTTGKFNGCWLTIDAVIPTNYAADPPDDWWQIRYTMTGSGTSNDVTTWKADIRGNPVHLVLP